MNLKIKKENLKFKKQVFKKIIIDFWFVLFIIKIYFLGFASQTEILFNASSLETEQRSRLFKDVNN